MAVNRRTVLKGLALSPLLKYVSAPLAAGTVAPFSTVGYSCIILHGMFFLEFDTAGKQLVVATPSHPGHWYYSRPHGGKNLEYLDSDLSFDVSNKGTQDFFPATMLTFPKSTLVRSGQVLTRSGAKYRCRMTLPYPEDILSLRQGPASAFHPKRPGNIADKLRVGDGKTVGTITCLRYQAGASGAFVRSFYAEHPMPPGCGEINGALDSAKDLCGSGFDLSLESCDAVIACTERDDELPTGVTHDDEWGLNELQVNHPCQHPQRIQAMKSLSPCPSEDLRHGRLGGDVSSCPQFGIG